MSDVNRIVGVAGLKRVGKDTAATFIKNAYGLTSFSFGAPVKETAMAMFGITREQAYGLNGYDRELVVEPWGISVRVMLQKVGTDCARWVFSQDHWVTRLKVLTEGHSGGFIVTDVRFDNEAEWINSQGGIVIVINRKGYLSDGHASEGGITSSDYTVTNNGTKLGLYRQLRTIMEEYYDR